MKYLHSLAKKYPHSAVALLSGVVFGLLLAGSFATHARLHLPGKESLVEFPKDLHIADSSILAKSAIVYDPSNGRVLYAKNSQVTMPLASITKLMTAQVALSNVSAGTVLTLSQKDVSVEGDAGDWNLKAGDKITLGNIIKLGLTASSNHAMSAAAAAVGAEYMSDLNKTASQLGLSHTYFLNSTGLDLSQDTSGAYGSAADMARLAAAFMREYPAYFETSTNETVSIPVSGRIVTAKATALPLLDIPGLIGAKTGYTDLAGGNVVAAFDADINHPLIAVVLGSTQEGRFADIRALIEAVRSSE